MFIMLVSGTVACLAMYLMGLPVTYCAAAVALFTASSLVEALSGLRRRKATQFTFRRLISLFVVLPLLAGVVTIALFQLGLRGWFGVTVYFSVLFAANGAYYLWFDIDTPPGTRDTQNRPEPR